MPAQVIGGIGLFLIGMVLATDGLRAAAGDALRRILLRFTGGPFKALLSGAAVTAIVQSSSATTMATIGFVGAGLLTFHQSLGIIFGANLGTTATSWIVAGLGLKFTMSTIALPMVGVGALVRLFVRGRGQHFGMAIAGFGMIFVGIDILQAGMGQVSELLTPADFPKDDIVGRLMLVGLGVLLTAIMQSSSAAMATTLTALHMGSMSLAQAAAMVIGVNVGTTVTAGLAAIGASVAAKRTALAHLLFNAVTGLVALAVLPGFVWLVDWLGDRIVQGDEALTLAAFHTTFNIAGVALLLPFSRRFADAIERIIPERGPRLSRYLEARAADMGAIAVEALRKTAQEIAGVTFVALLDILRSGKPTRASTERIEAAVAALRDARDYLAHLSVMEQLGEGEQNRHVSTIHALEHLQRLVHNALEAQTKTWTATAELREASAILESSLVSTIEWAGDPQRAAPVATVESSSQAIADRRKRQRPDILAQTARGQVSPAAAEKYLDSMRWLDETAYFLYRIADHLSGERVQEPPPSQPTAPTA